VAVPEQALRPSVAADDATTARLRVEARSGHRPERERHSAPEQHSAQQERLEAAAELSDPARHARMAAAARLRGEAQVEVTPAV
jgi:hypothetical protein